ncbi:phosphoserine phosphatase SerB [Trueperella abortisuis]|uniref:phosphoserine phosphatase SerB n=1 Tax=Trueperella abortisuis TaxID=445930 RepID=UPI0028936742|nr:phosphoserine phosphatase SerB [Trueperella abortisuis]
MLHRFSLVAPHPIPASLCHHVSQTIEDLTSDYDARPVMTVGLHAHTWLFEGPDPDDAGGYGSRYSTRADFNEELRGPAMALAIDSALMTGKMAEAGPAAIVTDVDSTFITTEAIEMLAAHAGVEEEVRAVTEAAMRGELDFSQSLAHRVAMLAGMPESVFGHVLAEVRLTPGARRLVEEIHARGGRFGLVSGGFTEVVGPLAEREGIDRFVANGLSVESGALTGRTYGTVIDGAAKVAAVETWEREWGIDADMVLCVGDGANDLPMMRRAGLGVAFQGKPVVREEADCAVSFPRLDAVAALVGWDIHA